MDFDQYQKKKKKKNAEIKSSWECHLKEWKIKKWIVIDENFRVMVWHKGWE